MAMTMTSIVEYRILALYRFIPLIPSPLDSSNNDNDDDDNDKEKERSEPIIPPEQHPTLVALQSELGSVLRKHQVKGTILLAPEGINGTICYPFFSDSTNDNHHHDYDDDPVVNYLKSHPLFGGSDLRTRLSVWKQQDHDHSNMEFSLPAKNNTPQQAFQRLKIKIKAEIVTLGLGRSCNNERETSNIIVPEGTTLFLNNEQRLLQQEQRYKTNHQLSNPLTIKGQYISPERWDDFAIHNPNILVIDTRNTYEIDIGTFENAIDPHTKNFSDLPTYLERLAEEYDWSSYSSNKCCDREETEEKKTVDVAEENSITGTTFTSYSGTSGDMNNNRISMPSASTIENTIKKKVPPEGIAMFCTGGIRCEKATSYAIQSNLFPKGFPIYHLEGGILAYLDHVARKTKGKEEDVDDIKMLAKKAKGVCEHDKKSTFQGECFVFDKRVAVTEGLRPSKKYISCHGCRGPMDYRLLLQSPDSCHGPKTAVECDMENARYQELVKEIPNLPPLCYDTRTCRYYLPGLTCPRCHASTTRDSLERFVERNRQVEICAKEGKLHFQDHGGGQTSYEIEELGSVEISRRTNI